MHYTPLTTLQHRIRNNIEYFNLSTNIRLTNMRSQLSKNGVQNDMTANFHHFVHHFYSILTAFCQSNIRWQIKIFIVKRMMCWGWITCIMQETHSTCSLEAVQTKFIWRKQICIYIETRGFELNADKRHISFNIKWKCTACLGITNQTPYIPELTDIP